MGFLKLLYRFYMNLIMFTMYVYKATLLYLSLYCILLQLHVDLIIK